MEYLVRKSNQVRTAIDLFCGSGSVSAALSAVGYHVAAAVDVDPICEKTYRANHPGTRFFREDIRKLAPWRLKWALAGARLDVLIVCAPCQPFSSQNRRRSPQDVRLDLVLQSIKFIRYLRPKTVLFENVRGIQGSEVMRLLLKELASLRYLYAAPELVDAADFEVPQRRLRCLLVASQDKKVIRNVRDLHTQPNNRVTVFDALKGLEELSAGEASARDRLHRARLHSELNLERLRHIPKDGGSRVSLPTHLQLACHQNLESDRKFPDVYGRLSWSEVAPTLTTGCTDITRGRFAHPEQDRAITLREAARLQSFPDRYKFIGNVQQIATQIGNAVPMKMMENILKRLSVDI
ncbi:DNA cytosine methyltransferase [uncultured Roseibium sp.]|uniref:DNA cytosine methyltransferase n=1 Tax=uncultured Roseibium sp. TaxID=1936171 RepID=UPI0032178654